LVIEQPKLALVVQIENRTATITRTVSWDPLLHRIEPLVCDACGQPSTRLFLCTGGHLAHEECLMPQCVDCKRAFCKLCENKMSACVVCDRPVCLHSLNRCGDCGRGTCREHVGLCHAAEGQPAKIVPQEVVAQPEPAPEPTLPRAVPEPEQPHMSSLKRKKAERERKAAEEAAAARRRGRIYEPLPRVTGDKLEVIIESREPVVSAAVLSPGHKPIAIRTWSLEEDGILVSCQCEKRPCHADDKIFEPTDAARIEDQIEYQIDLFRQEYDVPRKRVVVYHTVRENLLPLPRLALRGKWKDDQILDDVRAVFRQTYSRPRR
jgi:hypothetical protein